MGYHFTALHPYAYIKYEDKPAETTTTTTTTEKAQEETTEAIKETEWVYPDEPATFDYKYEVHDEKTGDIKRQSETSNNGEVKGQYSLIDSDGFRRVVEYTADAKNGFQATVRREPTHYKVPIPEQVKPVEEPKVEEPITEEITTEEAKAEEVAEVEEANEEPKNYEYSYEVHYDQTGDIKRQFESAQNGEVKGQYSLIDADGYRRVVKYTSDAKNGFQATVEREPTHYKIPEQVKMVEEPQAEEEAKIVARQAPYYWW